MFKAISKKNTDYKFTRFREISVAFGDFKLLI